MNPGVLEEGAKAAGGVIDALRSQPLALAMGLMNVALLLFLFYYLSRITSRTENTVQALFTAQDKVYAQWGTIVKDTAELADKSLHCITVDDALKLLKGGSQTPPSSPLRWPSLPSVPWLDRASSPVRLPPQ